MKMCIYARLQPQLPSSSADCHLFTSSPHKHCCNVTQYLKSVLLHTLCIAYNVLHGVRSRRNVLESTALFSLQHSAKHWNGKWDMEMTPAETIIYLPHYQWNLQALAACQPRDTPKWLDQPGIISLA